MLPCRGHMVSTPCMTSSMHRSTRCLTREVRPDYIPDLKTSEMSGWPLRLHHYQPDYIPDLQTSEMSGWPLRLHHYQPDYIPDLQTSEMSGRPLCLLFSPCVQIPHCTPLGTAVGRQQVCTLSNNLNKPAQHQY
ncbi:hypothetical protein ACOMHN_053632 [Nucella lapillus]